MFCNDLKTWIFQGKFPNSAYWFHQMYYGTNNAFRRSRTGGKITNSHPPLLYHHLDLQVEASRSPLLWSRCMGSWRRTPTTRFSTYPSSLAGDPVTMWQCDPVTSPDKFAWAKHWHLSPSLCYLRYIYLLFFLPSIACRHLSSVPEHPWASPIKKLSFFIQRTSGDFA